MFFFLLSTNYTFLLPKKVRAEPIFISSTLDRSKIKSLWEPIHSFMLADYQIQHPIWAGGFVP